MLLYSFYTIFAQIDVVTIVRQPIYKQSYVIGVAGVRKFGVYILEHITHRIVFFAYYICADLCSYVDKSADLSYYDIWS